jgi:hypothetical protein
MFKENCKFPVFPKSFSNVPVQLSVQSHVLRPLHTVGTNYTAAGQVLDNSEPGYEAANRFLRLSAGYPGADSAVVRNAPFQLARLQAAQAAGCNS